MVVNGVGGVQRRVGYGARMWKYIRLGWILFSGCIEKISQVGMELMLDFEFIGGVRMML